MSQQSFDSPELSVAGDNAGRRVALCVSYNGSEYFGWQAQSSGVPTVESELVRALSKVANSPVELVCAGRTDRGVHASQQFVHFDTSVSRSERAWVFGANSVLPKGISALWASEVDGGFHARYSALSRRYFYCIYNHPLRPANNADEVSWCHYPLDEQLMNSAAQALVGEHDFSSFRAAGCQSKTPFRNIHHIEVFRIGHMVIIDIQGNAFLHHMVRNIAGVLMPIGRGLQSERWCEEVLLAKDRKVAGTTAPPGGLYLAQVRYPDEFGLPIELGAPPFLYSMLMAAGRLPETGSSLWDVAFIQKP